MLLPCIAILFNILLTPASALNLGPDYPYEIEDLDADLPFSQPVTFAHLPWERCLSQNHPNSPSSASGYSNTSLPLDIAILGFPYDTSTSYRPGARFGPRGIRAASAREKPGRTFNTVYGLDAFDKVNLLGGMRIVDCGDIPITPFDAAHAFKQMEQGYRQVLFGYNTSATVAPATANPYTHPRILSLGGDHSIVLPILRSLKALYGPVAVIHLDSHLDTWDPTAGYTGIRSVQSSVTHGTFFWHAAREGCIARGSSVHAGLRTKLFSADDLVVDREAVGFAEQIEAREIDDPAGLDGIIRRTRKAVGDHPVYLSIDIDVLDPSIAPATGTPESGGWTTREVKRFIHGLQGIKLVGADVVEVSPPYDTNNEITSIAASDLLTDIIALMVKDGKTRIKEDGSGNAGRKDEL